MRKVCRSICLVLPLVIVLACGALCYGQDAGADAAKAMLRKGLKQFQAKDYQGAQATLLQANEARKSLSAAEQKALDEHLKKAAAASKAQAKAKGVLAAAKKALADNRLDDAETGFAAAAKSEYLTAADKQAAVEQLALVKERKAVAAAMPGRKAANPEVKPAAEADAANADPAAPKDAKAANMVARIKADRAKARQLVDAGRDAMAKRNYDEAKKLFEKALALAPEMEETRRLLKRARTHSGDVATGRRNLTRLQEKRKIDREASDVDIAVAMKRAREILAKPRKNALDFDSAESAVNLAETTLKRNRSLYPPSDYLAAKLQTDGLRQFIKVKRQAWVKAENEKKRLEIAEADVKRIVNQERRRQDKIRKLTGRIRTLDGRKQFQEALDLTDHLLKLEPGHRFASDQKILLTQLVSMRLEHKHMQTFNEHQRRSLVDIREAEIPWYDFLRYPDDWREITRRREPFGAGAMAESEVDQATRVKLRRKTGEVDFDETPFEDAIGFLRDVSGANIHVKWKTLEDEGIDDTAVVKNVKVTGVTVERLLRLVLEDVGGDRLGFVIDEGVVVISTKTDLAQNTTTRVYDIRDLIIEIRDFEGPRIDLGAVGNNASNAGNGGSRGGGGGLFGDDDDDDDDDDERKTKEELAEDIVDLIKDTIAPDSWRPDGEVGSITELNGQLVITQTAENHRDVLDLINQLREAKAIQIAIEARFITVSTGFLNSIGLDLDLYFNIGSRLGSTTVIDPYTGASVRTIRSLAGVSTTSGWGDGKGGEDSLTPIGVTQNTFGFANMLGMTSPIDIGTSIGANVSTPSLGVQGTFLDDFQVDFLIQATQAHEATRSLTAPRITLYNGQTAYVTVSTQQAYIADLEPIIAENAIAYNPVLATVPTGSVLTVTGTVSADRRYVTLEVSPQIAALNGFSNYFIIVSDVDEAGEPLTGAGLIQLPNVTIQELRTTVSVPDGGTLLLGGQRVSGQIEREKGVPLLSKIPLINRAFTNRGMIRDESTLLILIRPKIIIQREEEVKWFPE